jgi:hypothetical protein
LRFWGSEKGVEILQPGIIALKKEIQDFMLGFLMIPKSGNSKITLTLAEPCEILKDLHYTNLF